MCDFNNNILTIQSIQLNTLRATMSRLNNCGIREANLIFDDTGVKIMELETSELIVVSVYMSRDNFQLYQINTPKICVGINVDRFIQVLASGTSDDTITIFIPNDANHYNNGVVNYLSIYFENTYMDNLVNIPTIDLVPHLDEYPTLVYTTTINFTTQLFMQCVKSHGKNSNKLEIEFANNVLSFSTEGNLGKIVSTFKEKELNIVNSNPVKIIQGHYALRYLISFAKFASITDQLELCLENNMPLLCKFENSLAVIQLALKDVPKN